MSKQVDKKKKSVKWSNDHPNIRIREAILYQPQNRKFNQRVYFSFQRFKSVSNRVQSITDISILVVHKIWEKNKYKD